MFKVSGLRSWLSGGFVSLNNNKSIGLEYFQVKCLCRSLALPTHRSVQRSSFLTLFGGDSRPHSQTLSCPAYVMGSSLRQPSL